jgi:hypothetical protein
VRRGARAARAACGRRRPGSIAYSAVSQPLLVLSRNGRTVSSTVTVQSTFVCARLGEHGAERRLVKRAREAQGAGRCRRPSARKGVPVEAGASAPRKGASLAAGVGGSATTCAPWKPSLAADDAGVPSSSSRRGGRCVALGTPRAPATGAAEQPSRSGSRAGARRRRGDDARGGGRARRAGGRRPRARRRQPCGASEVGGRRSPPAKSARSMATFMPMPSATRRRAARGVRALGQDAGRACARRRGASFGHLIAAGAERRATSVADRDEPLPGRGVERPRVGGHSSAVSASDLPGTSLPARPRLPRPASGAPRPDESVRARAASSGAAPPRWSNRRREQLDASAGAACKVGAQEGRAHASTRPRRK